MAKKKIGEINNKPIVIGDKNLVTKNETHISELNRGSDSNFTDYTYFNFNSDNFNVIADLISMYIYEISPHASILPILSKTADSYNTYINTVNSVPSGYISQILAVAIPRYVMGELYTEDGYTMIEYSFGKSLDLFSAIAEIAPDIQLEHLTSSSITAKQFWNE